MQLDAQQPLILQDYLRRRGWLDNEEVISSIEKPGEVNMNYTLRIITPFRTLIIKQSRDYVEKNPALPAPLNRIVIEGSFYQEIQPIPMIASEMPLLRGIDRENNILVLEDLGNVRDYTFLYQSGQVLADADVLALTNYLSELHYHFTTQVPSPIFANQDMRLLNYDQIFNIPFLQDIDLNVIQPGLAELALPYKQDSSLKNAVRKLGQLYLADSFSTQSSSRNPTTSTKTLLHGDFRPGNWLQTQQGTIKVIDPGFCFYGPAEFDLGVIMAHIILAQQPLATTNLVSTNYIKPAGFDESLRQRFTGIEIIRRLIGSSSLPLSLSLEQKQSLLEESRLMLL